MFYMDDKKQALGAILGTKDGKMVEKKEPEDVDSVPKAIAQELHEAASAGDWQGVVNAHRALHAHFANEPDGDEGC